jgi:hypothetical protein
MLRGIFPKAISFPIYGRYPMPPLLTDIRLSEAVSPDKRSQAETAQHALKRERGLTACCACSRA